MMTCGEELRLSAAVSGEKSYQYHARIVPIVRNYGDGYRKYSCPICDSLGLKFSLPRGSDNCSCCGVNLYWEDIDYD